MIEGEMIVEFFKFLFKHCPNGLYYPLVRCSDTYTYKPIEDFMYTIHWAKDFQEIVRLIKSNPCHPTDRDCSWMFYNVGFHSTVDLKTHYGVANFSNPGDAASIFGFPALFVDYDDINLSGVVNPEEVFDRFKIWPSIRVNHSRRGAHWYWILKTPASALELKQIRIVQTRLAYLLGGDPDRTYPATVGRIPGMFTGKYLFHFITYKTTGFEYALSDFDQAPLREKAAANALRE